jgi:release factor glutamine methyltransferase
VTIRQLLAWARITLADQGEGDLAARLLLQAILNQPASYLIAHDDELVGAQDSARMQRWVERAAASEPIPYIIGRAPFYDAEYVVSPAVLIPRPETEGLVELALAWARQHRPAHIIDVGTGSGCIPITLARAAPPAHIWAIDISQAALTIARQNSHRLHVQDRVQLVNGDLLAPFAPQLTAVGPWLISANLPYISDLEWTELAVGVKSYEPALALKGGSDGLVLVERLLAQVATMAEHTKFPGALFLEIGYQQGSAGLALLQRYLPRAEAKLSQDYAGLDRYLSASLPGPD